jgi:cytochrome P450
MSAQQPGAGVAVAGRDGIAPLMPEVDFGIDPLEDFYERTATLREAGHRVVPVRFNGGIGWLILRHGDLTAAYNDEEGLPAPPAYERHTVPIEGRTLLAMTGEEHRINRLLLSSAFTPAAIRRLADTALVPIANRLIDAFEGQPVVDVTAAFARRYPFNVISHMLGIPVDDESQVIDWVFAMLKYFWDRDLAVAARDAFDGYIRPIIRARRADPGDDLISRLARAEVEGHRLSEDDILVFVRMLYPAGAETTFLAISSMLHLVLSSPATLARLRASPGDRPAAVEEALRREGPLAILPRFTERAVTIAGVAVPAQSWLLYGNGPAGHDPDEFADPDGFRLDRPANRHLAFGKGPHHCLGAHLAREEMRISLSLLLDRLPGLRLAAGPMPTVRGTGGILRGAQHLPVSFDAVLPAIRPAGSGEPPGR